MSDDQITELKSFINKRAKLTEKGLGQRIDSVEKKLVQRMDSAEKGLGQRIDSVEKNMTDRFDGVADIIEKSTNKMIDDLSFDVSLLKRRVSRVEKAVKLT